MKSTFRYAFAALATVLVAFSCKKEDKVVAPDIDCQGPQGTVFVGKPATFDDNTLDVKSRTWTFQDGTPATSSAASVEVTFTSAGEKTVKLEVVFTNGAKNAKELKVVVADPIEATIAVDKLTPMGCIRLGQDVTFSLAGVKGNPDKYEWSFEGGSPATSTEASPKVKFVNRDREMKVSCKVTRSSDNATETAEASYVVGNYPINKTWPAAAYDGVSFEAENASYWISWRSSGIDGMFSIANEGACGTGHSLKISTSPLMDVCASEGVSDPFEMWTDIFPRDSWGCNAPCLEAGKKYEISFWAKCSTMFQPILDAGVPPISFTAMMVVGWLEDWMNDPVFGNAAENFANTFDIPYNVCGNKIAYQNWEDITAFLLDGANWTKISVEFTPAETVYNAYPYFRVTALYDYLLIDEIEINLVEE